MSSRFLVRRLWNRVSLKSAVDEAVQERTRLGPSLDVPDAHFELAHKVRHRLVDVPAGACDGIERTLLLGALEESVVSAQERRIELEELRLQVADRVLALRTASERVSRLRLLRALMAGGALLSLLAGGVFWVMTLRVQPANLLSGAAWHVPSRYTGYELSGTLADSPDSHMFFSTNREKEPWILLTLSRSVVAAELVVENRSDCCDERPVPLLAEVSEDGKHFREVARISSPFKEWRVKFPPTKLRFLRLRSLKETYVHFRYIRLHAP